MPLRVLVLLLIYNSRLGLFDDGLPIALPLYVQDFFLSEVGACRLAAFTIIQVLDDSKLLPLGFPPAWFAPLIFTFCYTPPCADHTNERFSFRDAILLKNATDLCSTNIALCYLHLESIKHKILHQLYHNSVFLELVTVWNSRVTFAIDCLCYSFLCQNEFRFGR